MELKKKTLPIEEAIGWYLTQNEKRFWEEKEIDEETGNQITIERNEVLCGKGTLINAISQSLLIENGVKTVKVSNIPLLGTQSKSLNLWETVLKVRSAKGEQKKSYIVTGDCPSAAEAFISEYYEINVDATFEIVKVNEQKYSKVIKIYDTEKDELEATNKRIIWYKGQIYSMFDDEEDGDGYSGGSKDILVQATSFENAFNAIKVVMSRNEYDNIYNTTKSLSELKIVDVFMPEEDLCYYSDNELSKMVITE